MIYTIIIIYLLFFIYLFCLTIIIDVIIYFKLFNYIVIAWSFALPALFFCVHCLLIACFLYRGVK